MSSSKASGTVKNAGSSAPGGPKSQIRRRAAAEKTAKDANTGPAGPRAAGAEGSTPTLLKLYSDEATGFKVDPVVVMVLSVGFIASVFALHIVARILKNFASE
ncbi:translocon beta subunit Sbh1 [Schizosaccharomyces cryophilus OY26]|uniref:Protein transport protein Sec61 subunit beta n=1 Tax=Schizosaccharomyces cryophilus (strain OY26 / ATCC MYA-4695 / CBS 11777 / NBRC 106824 / NRRL Y48691) TaxID=653667 RepID=S9VRA6_SCHCR|nr:translocon beta subunit Sbh1 [Schizosaccharomyces cryophilus OY26]EPY50478.1 translocon beta subunit Sbh1 [Schizosaccharomyces cryophilus OY26]